MDNLLQSTIEKVKVLAGNDYLYFDDAVRVQLTPHNYPFSAWGVCVSPANQLYVMDNEAGWHEVKEDQMNYPLLIGSLHQRLCIMERLHQCDLRMQKKEEVK